MQRKWQQLTRTHALTAESRSTLRITTIQSQADDDDDALTNMALFIEAYVFQSTYCIAQSCTDDNVHPSKTTRRVIDINR